MTCVYRSDKLVGESWKCHRHGVCVPTGGEGKVASCDVCQDSLKIGDKKFNERWQDPLVLITRRREPASDQLRDLLAGGSAFLMGGGPSANSLPLERLGDRGCWTMAVNNVAGHPKVRPQAFVCSDPPSKFSHSIWLDPAVMKFVPTAKLGGRRARLREKKPDGTFVPLAKTTADCPNVWGFQRYSWLFPDDRFFTADGCCWGNHASGTEMTKQPKTVCTMLLAMRLLKFLGARRIYLVGVDFTMSPSWGYSFGQSRDQAASASNNAQFIVVNQWLCKMQEIGVFDRFGLEIYNTFQHSGLRAFPYVPFEAAVTEAQGVIETTPDLRDWYQK
jgi:hypothetical protein